MSNSTAAHLMRSAFDHDGGELHGLTLSESEISFYLRLIPPFDPRGIRAAHKVNLTWVEQSCVKVQHFCDIRCAIARAGAATLTIMQHGAV